MEENDFQEFLNKVEIEKYRACIISVNNTEYQEKLRKKYN